MKNKLLLFLIMLLFSIGLHAQWTWVTVHHDSVKPRGAAWETDYLFRKEKLLTAEGWTSRSNRGDTDNGKRYWPLLMGEMYLCRDNQTCIDGLVANTSRGGYSGIYGTYEGSFYKPFSCPGYAFYYFTYFDRITAVSDVQHSKVSSMWASPNRGYTCRTDGKMDPIYTCSEFNSENFCWMARIGGYLLSHYYNDVTLIPDGNKPAMTYYNDWVNNWVRGTFCAGRVEYESHIYFPFCFQAVGALYEFATDPMKKTQAKAVMDWMATEAAIRYLDGHMVGGESRNKNSGYRRFDGSGFPYYYLYYNDPSHMVTGVTDDSIKKAFVGDLHTSGFIANLDYRPPQAVIDIAQRKFNTPVEIHSAKPFYHLDNENYKYWNGLNTKSRRYEFATYYLEKNYTLASLTSGRPKGIDCFSEQCMWRLGVKGLYMQVFGNSGAYSAINGRCEYEQLAQLRNVMMRVIKGTTGMWVAVPTSVTTEYSGNNLYADLGNGVYMAVVPFAETGKSNAAYAPNTGDAYTKYSWTFASTTVGALVLEVGTVEEHGSYANFKTQVQAAALTS